MNVPDRVPAIFIRLSTQAQHLGTLFSKEQARKFGREWRSKKKKICRKARDIRLHEYKPLVLAAIRSLRDTEAYIVLPNLENITGNIKLYERRVRAIEEMRKCKHFLGHTTDIVQALDGHLRAHRWYYVCQGIMGYATQATFDPKSVRSYMPLQVGARGVHHGICRGMCELSTCHMVAEA